MNQVDEKTVETVTAAMAVVLSPEEQSYICGYVAGTKHAEAIRQKGEKDGIEPVREEG